LTDGVVAKKVSWSAVKAPRDVADILHKTMHQSERAGTNVTDTCGLYSLQESCDLLQSSYDNLYNDDSDESGSTETGISDTHGNVLSSLPNLNTAVNAVKDSGATLDVDTNNSSDSNSSDKSAMQKGIDLYSPDLWNSYYARLQEIGRAMRDREGWPNFDAVFMISATEGDGVTDIRVNSSQFLMPCDRKILCIKCFM